MSYTTLAIIIVLVAVVSAAIAIVLHHYYLRQRSRRLQGRFGPEYERLAESRGTPLAAENELIERQKRVAKFHIRPLNPEERRRYTDRWAQIQAEFVDNPKSSLSHADELLGEVMATRGYPVQDFDQRSADLSVDHPIVVQHYHAAHAIAVRDRTGQTTTEDLRQAMIHYRALFDELISEAHRAHAAE